MVRRWFSTVAPFQNAPDLWTLVGAAIISASGIYLVHRER